MVFSMIMIINLGTAFLISTFLPEQLSPLMHWVLEWAEYWLTKALFSLPGIILSIGAILLAIGALIVGGKGLRMMMQHAKERRNVLSLL